MNYSQRRNTLTKKQIASFSKWAVARPSKEAEANRVTEQQKKLWTALAQFIREQGGWVTSIPGLSPLRFEAMEHSKLPLELTKLGYVLLSRGTTTRIGGAASPEYGARWRQGARSGGYGFLTVSIYELDLPR